MQKRYKLVKSKSKKGIAAVVISGKKILLLRRRNIPLIMENPGIWSVVFGGKKEGESYRAAAYREIREETGLERKNITLLYKPKRMLVTNPRKMTMWYNTLFIFRSSTSKIRLDIENKDYRWAGMQDIIKEKDYTNVFKNRKNIENTIRRALNG